MDLPRVLEQSIVSTSQVWVRLKYVVGIHLHGRDFLRYKLNVALHLKRLGALFIFLSRLVGEAFAQTRLRTPNWSVTR